MRRRIWRGWILCLCACLLLCGAASGTGSTPPDAVSRGAFADALYDAHVAHGGAPVVSEAAPHPSGMWAPGPRISRRSVGLRPAASQGAMQAVPSVLRHR